VVRSNFYSCNGPLCLLSVLLLVVTHGQTAYIAFRESLICSDPNGTHDPPLFYPFRREADIPGSAKSGFILWSKVSTFLVSGTDLQHELSEWEWSTEGRACHRERGPGLAFCSFAQGYNPMSCKARAGETYQAWVPPWPPPPFSYSNLSNNVEHVQTWLISTEDICPWLETKIMTCSSSCCSESPNPVKASEASCMQKHHRLGLSTM
jgi:hypothetical protein